MTDSIFIKRLFKMPTAISFSFSHSKYGSYCPMELCYDRGFQCPFASVLSPVEQSLSGLDYPRPK